MCKILILGLVTLLSTIINLLPQHHSLRIECSVTMSLDSLLPSLCCQLHHCNNNNSLHHKNMQYTIHWLCNNKYITVTSFVLYTHLVISPIVWTSQHCYIYNSILQSVQPTINSVHYYCAHLLNKTALDKVWLIAGFILSFV